MLLCRHETGTSTITHRLFFPKFLFCEMSVLANDGQYQDADEAHVAINDNHNDNRVEQPQQPQVQQQQQQQQQQAEQRGDWRRQLMRGVPTRWPTELHQLIHEASDVDWGTVMHRLQTHPEDALFVGRLYKQSMLHFACMQYAPVHVVQELLALVPDTLVGAQNKDDETPLLVASYSASEQVQLALLQRLPQAVAVVDQDGDSPLHKAVEQGASLHLLQQMCRASPSTISLPNRNHATPFSLLGRTYVDATCLQKLEKPIMDDDNDDNEAATADEEDDEEGEMDWKAAKLFLREARPSFCTAVPRWSMPHPIAQRPSGTNHKNSDNDDDNDNDEEDEESLYWLHAAAATPARPIELLETMLRFYPEQAVAYDTNGMTPLLYACVVSTPPPPPPVIPTTTRTDPPPQDNDDDNDKNDDKKKNAIGVLVVGKGGRVAASMPCRRNGRLPLMYALESSRRWSHDGVEALVRANPKATDCRDVVTGLYPFQLAAAALQPDLETIYQLVRGNPQHLQQQQQVQLLTCSSSSSSHNDKKNKNKNDALSPKRMRETDSLVSCEQDSKRVARQREKR